MPGWLPDPPREPVSGVALPVLGGFIGQSVSGEFSGPGKYICIGQAPEVTPFGGRYGVTIRNGMHHCSLRVVTGQQGDSILSWGNSLLRFRYEGTWGLTGRARDIIVVNRRGQVVVYGGVTSRAYYYTSDARLKEGVEPIEGALQKVLTMRGLSFRLRETSIEDAGDEQCEDQDELPMGPLEGMGAEQETEQGGRRLGLLAQDVEKVFPEIVATDEEGFKSMDATQINAVLVEAIKDQQKIIDEQVARLESQQSRLDRLEKALAKLGIEL